LKHILVFFIILFPILSYCQNKVNYWPILAKISYKKEYDELLGIKIDRPIFSNEVKGLERKVVQLKGYIIPTDGFKSHQEFVFSAFPYSMCFFCGQAGPETVLEVKAKKPIQFTSEQIEIKGILVLNKSDFNRLMYQLIDVEEVK